MANNRWRLEKRLLQEERRHELQKLSDTVESSLQEYLNSGVDQKVDKRHKPSKKRFFRVNLGEYRWGDHN